MSYGPTGISYSETADPGLPPIRTAILTRRVRIAQAIFFVSLQRQVFGEQRLNTVAFSIPIQLARKGGPAIVASALGPRVSNTQLISQEFSSPSGFQYGLSSSLGGYSFGYSGDALQATISGQGLASMIGGLDIYHGVHPVSQPNLGSVIVSGDSGDAVVDGMAHLPHTVVGSADAFPVQDPVLGDPIAIRQSNALNVDESIGVNFVHPAPYQAAWVHIHRVEVKAVIGSFGRDFAFGEIDVDVNGVRQSSPLGSEGDFYFTSIPSGVWDAKVTYGAGTCRANLRVPKTSDVQIDHGHVVCDLTAKRQTVGLAEPIVTEGRR